eukprot:CAMPEP_0174902014 /NCGR_PEP_ID=MMETSP0167-20121228/36442_1 /TAXON_ID=38298 /ORGANISM="Rhodella maculata, Strain CCMP736" /LENGTH=87 /DNA_ID=CAMNT_0016143873 /DNA_START=424 /DNA_END=684 /DNA_ORIENTATION=+
MADGLSCRINGAGRTVNAGLPEALLFSHVSHFRIFHDTAGSAFSERSGIPGSQWDPSGAAGEFFSGRREWNLRMEFFGVEPLKNAAA